MSDHVEAIPGTNKVNLHFPRQMGKRQIISLKGQLHTFIKNIKNKVDLHSPPDGESMLRQYQEPIKLTFTSPARWENDRLYL
jgi:hypothetical protein